MYKFYIGIEVVQISQEWFKFFFTINENKQNIIDISNPDKEFMSLIFLISPCILFLTMHPYVGALERNEYLKGFLLIVKIFFSN